jgi:hypothetical protein
MEIVGKMLNKKVAGPLKVMKGPETQVNDKQVPDSPLD